MREDKIQVGKQECSGGELEDFDMFGIENSPFMPNDSGACQCQQRGRKP